MRLVSRSNTGLFPKRNSSRHLEEEGGKDARLAELELETTRLHLQLERLEKSLQEHQVSTHRLQALYQHAPIGYVTLDEKGNIIDWNSAAVELLGAKEHGLGNTPLNYFVIRGDLHILLDHLMRCKRGKEERVLSELRLKGPSGRIPVQIRSVPVHSGGTRFFQTALLDLTEREQHEFALREAKEFSDAIIQTIHEPLLVLDINLKIIRMNEAFSRLFGTTQRLAKNLSFEALLNIWWAGNELRARLEHCLQEGVALNDFEFEVELRKLGKRTFIFNARRLHPKEDSPPVLLVALEDVTARKEAEERVAASHHQLQELNNELEKRVEARTGELRESNKQLESFCYSIAHDLRGPLRAMAGFGAILEQRYGPKLGTAGADYIRRIIGGAKQMDVLIRDLLEYGRFNTIQFPQARIDADEILSRVIGHLQPAITETHASIERKGRLPYVVGHGVALEAAFSNLLSNALKFVPPETAPKVTIWPEEREKEIAICIADNGIGIPEQHQRKIFEVFQRLHPQKEYPGTGIGLAIVSKAVERMGGRVGVESEPGKGSRFWINLPRPPG